MFSFFIALRVLYVVEIDGLAAISVTVEQGVEIQTILAILDYVILLFLFYFLKQAHTNIFPPLYCPLRKLVLARCH
jgi:hypothetical protein